MNQRTTGKCMFVKVPNRKRETLQDMSSKKQKNKKNQHC